MFGSRRVKYAAVESEIKCPFFLHANRPIARLPDATRSVTQTTRNAHKRSTERLEQLDRTVAQAVSLNRERAKYDKLLAYRNTINAKKLKAEDELEALLVHLAQDPLNESFLSAKHTVSNNADEYRCLIYGTTFPLDNRLLMTFSTWRPRRTT